MGNGCVLSDVGDACLLEYSWRIVGIGSVELKLDFYLLNVTVDNIKDTSAGIT